MKKSLIACYKYLSPLNKITRDKLPELYLRWIKWNFNIG
jgi:hypothetical protein